MNKSTLAKILIIISTFFVSFGQISWKIGVKNFNTLLIITGFLLYAFSAVLMIFALKYEELSKIHPFLALGFVWITVLAPIFVGEVLTIRKVISIILIITGVVLIGLKWKK